MRTRLWAVGILIVFSWILVAFGDGRRIASRTSFASDGVVGTPHSITPDGGLPLTWSNEVGICLYRAEGELGRLEAEKG